ncbi:hypothetical protein Esti_001620 [Eimeria stiedai]
MSAHQHHELMMLWELHQLRAQQQQQQQQQAWAAQPHAAASAAAGRDSQDANVVLEVTESESEPSTPSRTQHSCRRSPDLASSQQQQVWLEQQRQQQQLLLRQQEAEKLLAAAGSQEGRALGGPPGLGAAPSTALPATFHSAAAAAAAALGALQSTSECLRMSSDESDGGCLRSQMQHSSSSSSTSNSSSTIITTNKSGALDTGRPQTVAADMLRRMLQQQLQQQLQLQVQQQQQRKQQQSLQQQQQSQGMQVDGDCQGQQQHLMQQPQQLQQQPKQQQQLQQQEASPSQRRRQQQQQPYLVSDDEEERQHSENQQQQEKQQQEQQQQQQEPPSQSRTRQKQQQQQQHRRSLRGSSRIASAAAAAAAAAAASEKPDSASGAVKAVRGRAAAAAAAAAAEGSGDLDDDEEEEDEEEGVGRGSSSKRREKYEPFSRMLPGLWIDTSELPAAEAAASSQCSSSNKFPLLVDFAAAAAAAYGEEHIKETRSLSFLLQQEFFDSSRPLTKQQEKQLALLQEEAAAGPPNFKPLTKQFRPALEGDTAARGLETAGEASKDKFSAGGLWRPSRLDMLLHDIERRLERQRLLANPRDILRGGGGDKGDYYDKDDGFIDDAEVFSEFGWDPATDFVSSASEEEDEASSLTQGPPDLTAFVAVKMPLPADSSESEGGDSNQDEEDDEAVLDPKGWRAFRARLRLMMEKGQLAQLEELEETLQRIHQRLEGPEAMTELESIVGRYIRRACAAGMQSSKGKPFIVDLNWSLVKCLGSAMHRVHSALGIELVHRCWVRRLLVANVVTYDQLTSTLFTRAFKSSSLFNAGPQPIRKVQRLFEAWVEADRKEKRLQRQLEQLQQQQTHADLQAAAEEEELRRQLEAAAGSKERLLHASPLWRIGRFLLDIVLLFNLRRGDVQEYAELALGEEADLLPDTHRDMGTYLLCLLKTAVEKKFGAEEPLTLSPQYMRALVFKLKDAFRVGGLCERRVRRARTKTFVTALCKAAAGDAAAVQTPEAAAAASENWHEDSDTEGPETETEEGTAF